MIPKPPTVIVITTTPKEFSTMVCGIPSKLRAEAWAEKMGHPVVWWHRRLERVYVPKNGRVG
jgi:hypothetical protein